MYNNKQPQTRLIRLKVPVGAFPVGSVVTATIRTSGSIVYANTNEGEVWQVANCTGRFEIVGSAA